MLLDTDRLDAAAAAGKVLATLELLGMVKTTESAAYTAEEEEIIRRRLQDLGYL